MKSNKMTAQECIVCGCAIWWDSIPLPVACFSHTYGEVYNAAQQKMKPTSGTLHQKTSSKRNADTVKSISSPTRG